MGNDKRWLNIIKLLLKLLITVLSLWWVARKINFAEVADAFKHTNLWYILIAVLFFSLSKFISAIRLNIFFNAIKLALSGIVNLRLYWLGMFYNLFLPGGIGGDGYKIWWLNNRFNYPAKKLFWAILLDRVSGLVALGILTVVLLYFVHLPPSLFQKISESTFYWSATGLAFLILSAFYLSYRYYFKEFLSCFWLTNFQGILVQVAQLICVAFILKALGITDHYKEYLLIFLISSVIAVLPFTIGGLGARELVFLFGSQYLMLDMHYAVTISLWFYLITAAISFAGIYYVSNGKRLVDSR
ncbi:hypothetical protein D3C80_442310 [compost metagenome]